MSVCGWVIETYAHTTQLISNGATLCLQDKPIKVRKSGGITYASRVVLDVCGCVFKWVCVSMYACVCGVCARAFSCMQIYVSQATCRRLCITYIHTHAHH